MFCIAGPLRLAFCSQPSCKLVVVFYPLLARSDSELYPTLEKLKGQKLRGTNLPGEHACSLAALDSMIAGGHGRMAWADSDIKICIPRLSFCNKNRAADKAAFLPPFPSQLAIIIVLMPSREEAISPFLLSLIRCTP